MRSSQRTAPDTSITRSIPTGARFVNISLASEASNFGGIYATHMRNESDSVLESIDEAVRIGHEAHIPVEIWHFKVGGKPSWGRMPEVVAKINSARAQGIDITADTYAYPAWFNDFFAFIPAC